MRANECWPAVLWRVSYGGDPCECLCGALHEAETGSVLQTRFSLETYFQIVIINIFGMEEYFQLIIQKNKAFSISHLLHIHFWRVKNYSKNFYIILHFYFICPAALLSFSHNIKSRVLLGKFSPYVFPPPPTYHTHSSLLLWRWELPSPSWTMGAGLLVDSWMLVLWSFVVASNSWIL